MRTINLFIAFLLLSFVQLNAQWFEQNSGTNELLNSVFFIDGSTGWACGSNGKIIKTQNGGINWGSQISNANYLFEIQFIDSNNGWACGGNQIVITTNGGSNWNTVTFADTAYIVSIRFVNANTGWILVNYPTSAKILKSTNGGDDWTTQFEVQSGWSWFEDLFFIDENIGWVSTSEQGIYKTTDGGTNWTNYTTNFLGSPQQIFFINPQIGWVFSNTLGSTSLSKTTDGGVTWTPQLFDNTKIINSIFFMNENIGYAAGLKFSGWGGFVMQTTDGGDTWIQQYNGVNELKSIFFNNNLLGWAVGSQGRIVNTVNGGLPTNLITFSTDSIYIPTLSDSGSVMIVNTSDYDVKVDSIISVGYFYGYWGEFKKPGFLFPFYLVQSIPGFMGDTLGIIIPAQDSINVSFYNVDLCPICDYEVQDYFEDTLKFVFTFMDGNVYSFSKSIPISGEGHMSDVEDDEVLVSEFVLEQNYPNPFNPSTKISWQSPVGSWQTLKVYDILGNEIATLVNEYLNAGTYEIDFTAVETLRATFLPSGIFAKGGYASGVYFYRLQTGSYSETKKMIFLK